MILLSYQEGEDQILSHQFHLTITLTEFYQTVPGTKQFKIELTEHYPHHHV